MMFNHIGGKGESTMSRTLWIFVMMLAAFALWFVARAHLGEEAKNRGKVTSRQTKARPVVIPFEVKGYFVILWFRLFRVTGFIIMDWTSEREGPGCLIPQVTSFSSWDSVCAFLFLCCRREMGAS